MLFDVRPTVNPLLYTIKLTWSERVSGLISNQVWNLLQMWLTTNECVPNGNVSSEDTSLTVIVIVKRRMGNPKNESP